MFKKLVKRLVLKGVIAPRSRRPRGYREHYGKYGDEHSNWARLYRAEMYDCAVLDWERWELEIRLPIIYISFVLNEGTECCGAGGLNARVRVRKGRLYHKLHDLLYGFRHDEIPF